MKKVILFLLIVVFFQISRAQYVGIPDANFAQALRGILHGCVDDVVNKLDTTCTEVQNLTVLDVSNRNISSLQGVQYFRNLWELDCQNNKITSIPLPIPQNLEILDCSHNLITALPTFPGWFEFLKCYNNKLTSLPILPPKLISLKCDSNQLTSLPALPDYLYTLTCAANKLTSLPAIDTTLGFLDCSKNKITSLPDLPASLEQLYCSQNLLTTLPPLITPGMSELLCDNNLITSLPDMPFMWWLDCSNNRLPNLPDVSNVRSILICSGNRLSSLPVLSDSLGYLDCSYNELISLPRLPRKLLKLYCYRNMLTSLPPLPDGLQYLHCYNNLLTSLPPVPCLQELFCQNNKITCLPPLPDCNSYYTNLKVKGTLVSCIPFRTFLQKDTAIATCTNPNDLCFYSAFVQGHIYFDANNNGVHDSSEQYVPFQEIKVSGKSGVSVSDPNGYYFLQTDTNATSLWYALSGYRYSTITPASYSVYIDSLGSPDSIYDFGIYIIPGIKDLAGELGSSHAKPGFSTSVNLMAYNYGTVNQTGVTIKIKKPSGFDTVFCSVTPSFFSNDTLIWQNVSLLYLGQKPFNVILHVPVNAVPGTFVTYESWVNGISGDTTPADNYSKWTEKIRSSFDPNDKAVSKTILSPTYDPDQDKLIYTIQFQNTGTAEATTVVVRDIIPDNLDITSLRVVNASHPYQLIVRDKNIVEIAFPNIQLPDSNINEAKSHGFVQLEFKPKAGLTLNDSINNKASILFDYNAPVVTNTATTKIQIVTGIASNKNLDFKLFPNPSSQNIHVRLPYSGNGKWYITDIAGRIIKQETISSASTDLDIDISEFSTGIYIFSVELNGILSSSKVEITR